MRPPGVREQLRRRLFLAARDEVQHLIKALPPEVRTHADHVPVVFEMIPRPTDLREGIEPDTLGLFTGNSLAESADTTAATPTEIILFMENIWDYAGHNSTDFREELRRTYLHELGHYLGLDEEGLAERNLD